jgi:signal transduction histidine kinase
MVYNSGMSADVSAGGLEDAAARRARLFRLALPVLVPFLIGIAAAMAMLVLLLDHHHWVDYVPLLLMTLALGLMAIAYMRQARDVLDQQRKLSARLERERELGNLKSRFVSMISHEIRTPLTTIYAASDILKHYGTKMTQTEHLQEIDAIQAEVRAITGLVDDVITVDDNAERGPRLKFEPVDLAALARETWNRSKILLQAKHELDLEVTGASGPVVVEVTRFRQILDNLLTNAIKYSPPAEKVRLSLNLGDGWLTIRVRDRGIGIPAADRARVFEAFHRGANVEAVSGSGLGLAVVQRAATQLGGTVRLESELGQGTEVEVRLPEAAREGMPG